ncbi:MAG: AAA family ATPase [Myxococcaceae bacterium]|nr:AAA family ATPase [Myxococcaceae bacterium]
MDERLAEAGEAFRRFFGELRDAFLEREAVFTQIELALLCREHVLVLGPPGTAKSAIATSVLARIVDASTGKPSLFSKQLAENTVQTDLIGAVDFKVLTETGRTEYLTDDGMLGATHAFLDEVFDGRDMLLRSILNVLHERELKHGRKVTPGRCECAIMTSNRYLSEVLARSPETLQAFADRISFISFCPKSFARKQSRGQMLQRAEKGLKPTLSASLTLQQLDVLQAAVERVEVGGEVLEGIEAVADALERELLAQVVKLPDYVPTKYFSQRSSVKALWSLKAAVVRDRIFHHPARKLVATTDDLASLRYFFLLGGPPAGELEVLLKSAVDPRERAQLEIIRLEHRLFDQVLASVLPTLQGSAQRESQDLGIAELRTGVATTQRAWNAQGVVQLAKALQQRLVPGPRHPDNRKELVMVAQALMSVASARLAKGPVPAGETRGSVGQLAALIECHQLARRVPELSRQVTALGRALEGYGTQMLDLIAASAEDAELDEGLKLEALGGLASNLADELSNVAELAATLGAAGQDRAAFAAALQRTREQVGAALRRRAERLVTKAPPKAEVAEVLAADGRKLKDLEGSLAELSPRFGGLREDLLTPAGQSLVRERLAAAQFEQLEQLVPVVEQLVEELKRAGLEPAASLQANRAALEQKIAAHARSLEPPKLAPPQLAQVLSGETYQLYRRQLAATAPDGALAALASLDGLLQAPQGQRLADGPVRQTLALCELASLHARGRYLRAWLSQLLTALPVPEELPSRAEAQLAFDKFVKSQLQRLISREGELVRLLGACDAFSEEAGEVGETAKKVGVLLRGIAEDYGSYTRRLIDVAWAQEAPRRAGTKPARGP